MNHSISQYPLAETKPVIACPFCESRDIVKKGNRRKKYEAVQLYLCKRCRRRFTPLIHKGRTYPLKLILNAFTLYNRLYSLEDVAEILHGSFGIRVSLQTIANWLKDFKKYLLILKFRPLMAKQYDRRKVFLESRLLHGQVYDFKFHFAKLDIIFKKYRQYQKFWSLMEFLESVPGKCPHELFRANAKKANRSSNQKNIFNIDQVKIISRTDNAAIRNARFVLQAVANNKLRHETLQEFMLVNDLATVAAEVPVVLTARDIDYFKHLPGFILPVELHAREAITGHIDLVQLRDGLIYILDYKPQAKREKPVEQLTLYALALARLAKLPLYDFKCAWFDDKNYYEFYPLHVVHKK
jgi:transposase-like protein